MHLMSTVNISNLNNKIGLKSMNELTFPYSTQF